MQKVVGSSPISRFSATRVNAGYFTLRPQSGHDDDDRHAALGEETSSDRSREAVTNLGGSPDRDHVRLHFFGDPHQLLARIAPSLDKGEVTAPVAGCSGFDLGS